MLVAVGDRAGALVLPAELPRLSSLAVDQNELVTKTPDLTGYHSVGPKEYLDRLLEEYGLIADELGESIVVRRPPGIGGAPGPPEYLVHESLLRSHDPFRCAGDTEALDFCLEIAHRMTDTFGISRHEAIARINQHWSAPGPDGRTPRVWIIGLDIAYHETPKYWAQRIIDQTV